MRTIPFSWPAAGLLLISLSDGCVSTPHPPPVATTATATVQQVATALPLPAAKAYPPPVAPTNLPPQTLMNSLPPSQINAPPAAQVDLQAASKADPLKQFMADRPAAAQSLRQHPALAEWFRTEWRRPAAYPIVWDNHPPLTSPVAENSSSSENQLTAIRVSFGLSPVDQLMGLCYETCNSEGRPRINELADQAAHRKITREEFTEGIAQAEYAANFRLKETFPKLLPLPRSEILHDTLYRNMLAVPATYAEYKAWNQRTHNQNFQHAQELYAREYDDLVRQGPATAKP